MDVEGELPPVDPPRGVRSSVLKGVLARESNGALFPAQIVREGEQQLRGASIARLKKQEDGSFRLTEFDRIAQKDIVERFDLPAKGRLPESILQRLAEEAPHLEPPVPQPVAENSDPVDVDFPSPVDGIVEQVVEEARVAEFSRWSQMTKKQRKAAVRENREKRRKLTEERISKAMDMHFEVACAVLKTERARKLLQRENKAKGHILATKEEIEQGLFKEADWKELARWCVCSVFDLFSQTLTPQPGVKGITLRWVRTWKLKEGKRVAKSRLIARGFQDPRDSELLKTYSGTADAGLARVAFVWALSWGWQAAKVDVSTAFLQAPIGEGVWQLRLPNDLPIEVYPGLRYRVYIKIVKAVYGLADAPKCYTDFFKKKVRGLGWTEVCESILVKRNRKGEAIGLMVMHIDDLFVFSPSVDDDIAAVCTMFNTDELERMDNGEMHTYVSMSVCMRDGEMLLDQSVYIMNMAESVSLEAKKPITDKDFLLPTEKDVDPSLQKEQQRNVGALGWAVRTQPSLLFLFSHLFRSNTRPSLASVLAPEKALWHAKVTAKPLKLKKVRGVPVLVVWVDASYQLSLREGKLGWEMQILDQEEVGDLERVSEDNTVVWASKKCTRKLGSTTTAELFAMRDGVKLSFSVFNLIKKLWGVFPKVLVVSDS
uniref:Reverse transcriptase Ty1/copia-type domain-containing protein n=1 Tax=Chromera velia CCMP2878 TaxID=1169474 RepID=A0A0G4F0B1_9ALVE|eukprot:Cvel_14432.t1-p1 / transcript=Cvel_14432.t1 / gene=Cvel_14432 / organism=Chromera_velia_CCMP2878 / gene_product=Copia protein, putative / transcript_product=Copia protein, putative / location=Cvel_scaffold1026:56148-58115(+) / protein_length=656 / sequence_SO=supercontig / SO=protein_coding / is_pseudo=false